MKYIYYIKLCINFYMESMNDELFYIVYDCFRFRVIRWWGGLIDNFRVSLRFKVFCNLIEFFINKFNFFRRGVGVMVRWIFLLFFVSKVLLFFYIIYKIVVMNMCRKLSFE